MTISQTLTDAVGKSSNEGNLAMEGILKGARAEEKAAEEAAKKR